MKRELLLKIRENERVIGSGRHRPPIDDRGVYPLIELLGTKVAPVVRREIALRTN